MKKYNTIAAVTLLFLIFFIVHTAEAQDKKFGFTGVATCGMCHKKADQGNQLKIWEESKHAVAYKTLQTPEADKIAQQHQVGEKAAEAEACLKCHASGYNVEAELLSKKFKVEDGVQCETCHGPGSEYKIIHSKGETEKAMELGLEVHSDDMEEFCVSCHNPDSPTYVEFDLEKMWEKIAHPIQKDK